MPAAHEPHRWHKWKAIPWVVCRRCGLVRLRNRLTDLCVRLGCNYQEHRSYQAELRRGVE